MRPEDETPATGPPDDATDGEGGEHAPPPPATWAGRRRAAGDAQPPDETPSEETADEPVTEEPAERADEVGSGRGEDVPGDLTEEFDEIERGLAEELAKLEAPEAGAPEADGPDAVDREDQEDEEDEEDQEDEEDELDADADGESEPGSPPTVEAETLAVADREEAREAALAGLRARAEQHEIDRGAAPPPPADSAATSAETTPPEPEPEPVAVAEDDGGKPPRAKPLWARFLAASLLIVVSMAAATSISLLVYLTDIAKGLGDNDKLAPLRSQLADAEGGAPQTILILGSDKRLGTRGDPGRSDTTILLRVDPDKDRIALLSIPRDLKVNIPTIGIGKFNEAYAAGGPELAFKTVKQLTGLDINHVVNINFTGFADAVNAIGCVYIDVDRHYYIPPNSGVAEINVEAGYQRLCGLKALQYVRYRHTDTDLVRSARQQDFLREARQKLPPETLIRERNELLDIFTKYTTSDIGDAVPLLELLKTFVGVQSAPVLEVHFPADLGDGTSGYVTASQSAIKKAVAQFLDTEGTPGERPSGEASPPDSGNEQGSGGGGKGGGKNKPGSDHFVGPKMDDATAQGQEFAHQTAVKKRKDGKPMIDFPIYYPTRLVPGSTLSRDSRAFPIDAPDKDVFHGYKMVATYFGPGGFDEYYGVSGTDWVDAPILDNPSETRTIDGKEYSLFYDGDRLRLVGWKTKDAAYWVDNTLLQSLDEGQMLSIATSMREYTK